MTDAAARDRDADASPGAGHRTGRATHPILDLRRPFAARVPDSSVGGVRRVAQFDARTHVVAAREPGGTWYRLLARTRFTRDTVRTLRAAGISEVVLRRGLHSASFPLAWVSDRSR